MLDRPSSATGYTVADLLAMDDIEGVRFELHEGMLLVVPPPLSEHQEAESDLQFYLRSQRRRVYANVGVMVDDVNYRIPDLVVLKKGEVLVPKVYQQPPSIIDIAIEIVSPTSRTQDRMIKPLVYARVGIPQYWLVEELSGERIVIMHELQGGKYVRTGETSVKEMVGED
ncbi:Uma2 family endonuclease [Dactylosporangium sp. McL0621]|uniref:Uma2 family endonuclease n=1 Tax=Dactylosporangium sp. McL0621 TaxID=3415678 RepID=UPI003CF158F4